MYQLNEILRYIVRQKAMNKLFCRNERIFFFMDTPSDIDFGILFPIKICSYSDHTRA